MALDCQIGIGLADYQWIGIIFLNWSRIGDGLTLNWHRIGNGLAMDWQLIGEGLAELADIGLAMDWHWIGF